MKPTISFPTHLPEGTLHRITYQGMGAAWQYEYDLCANREGYECHVRLRVPNGAAVQHIQREDLREVLVQTTRAMREITDETSAWETQPGGEASVIALRMRLGQSQHCAFGDVVGRILPELPRLHEATITAYYR